MACFLVPAAEAIVVSTANKLSDKKGAACTPAETTVTESRITFRDKAKWLQNMLWGGSALLLFEHVWHGEIVPWFPFLTAAENPADFAGMIQEMATTGVTMALAVTGVWGLMLLGANVIEKRALAMRRLSR